LANKKFYSDIIANKPRPTFKEIIEKDSSKPPDCILEESFSIIEDSLINRDSYISKEFHDLEVEKVWKKTWQFACREEDIPQIGDYYTYNIANLSVIILKTKKGYKAFYNSCLHRGTQLKPDNTNGNSKNLRCPFHGWTWSLEGELIDLPCDWDFPHVKKNKSNLKDINLDIWGGFIFINFNEKSEKLSTYLSVLPNHFKIWKMEKRKKIAHVAKIVPCNWKFAMEAFLEGYHVATTHPQSLIYTGDENCQYDFWGNNISRMMSALGNPSPKLNNEELNHEDILHGMKDFLVGDINIKSNEDKNPREILSESMKVTLKENTNVDHSQFSTSEIIDAIQYHIFPNFVPWAGYGVPIVYRFRPNGDDPKTSIIDVILLQADNDPTKESNPNIHWLNIEDSWTKAEELGGLGEIFDQDESAFAAGQKGLECSSNEKITLSLYQESRIRFYHKTLEEYLAT
tara:strand:- start:1557 stop:2927 length:1371 start_codon:yes stop_codon:yes gene_type:complete